MANIENTDRVKVLINEFVDSVIDVCSKSTNIIFANGLDLLEMDMGKFSTETYFISDMSIERGTMQIVKNETAKKKLYKFCIENEDRVFRGTKFLNEVEGENYAN